MLKVALLTAGKDPQYALGLATALADVGIELEVVGNSEMEAFPRLRHSAIRTLNLRGDQSANASALEKVRRVLLYYARLVHFAWNCQSSVFHILWPNKFVYFDRTILNLYYRSLGKKLVFTAHNVNTELRDQRDSALNRLSLRFHYRLMDHVFVHTDEMKRQLTRDYGMKPANVTVLTFPVNNVTPRTSITGAEARFRLGIPLGQNTILFFGNVAAYKGLEDLIRALPVLRESLKGFRTLIAGSVKKGAEDYVRDIRQMIRDLDVTDLVDLRIDDYIPEQDVELYFKSADLLVLPYRRIFQSGVLFLAYSFGLPVIVADAGSLRQDVIEGETGFVCRHSDPKHLAEQVNRYFNSDLFAELKTRRNWIISHTNERYSWERLASTTRGIYDNLVTRAEQPVSSTL